jgi:NAD(P)-dependent dehydrogenase (short-subunit alcohol dehydrogenase family)
MTQLAKFGSLRGKRVFITGGGTGIGEAMVISFAEQGAKVAFVDIARDASLALIRRVKEAGYPEPLFRPCDITDIPALQATMADLAAAVGDFDILVNNAANDQRMRPPKSRSITGTNASPSTSVRCSSPASRSSKE